MGTEGSIRLQPRPSPPAASALAGPPVVGGDRVLPSNQSGGSPPFSIQDVNFTRIHFSAVHGARGGELGNNFMAIYNLPGPGRPAGNTTVRTQDVIQASDFQHHGPPTPLPCLGRRLSRERWVQSGSKMNPLSSTSRYTFKSFQIIFNFLIKVSNIEKRE